MKTFKQFLDEEAPVNAAGSGNIAGLGVGPQGEPGVSVAVRKRHKKRAGDSLIMMPLVRRLLNQKGLGTK